MRLKPSRIDATKRGLVSAVGEMQFRETSELDANIGCSLEELDIACECQGDGVGVGGRGVVS